MKRGFRDIQNFFENLGNFAYICEKIKRVPNKCALPNLWDIIIPVFVRAEKENQDLEDRMVILVQK